MLSRCPRPADATACISAVTSPMANSAGGLTLSEPRECLLHIANNELLIEFHRVTLALGRISTFHILDAQANVSSDVIRRRLFEINAAGVPSPLGNLC